jgi:hypothetical protein
LRIERLSPKGNVANCRNIKTIPNFSPALTGFSNRNKVTIETIDGPASGAAWKKNFASHHVSPP